MLWGLRGLFSTKGFWQDVNKIFLKNSIDFKKALTCEVSVLDNKVNWADGILKLPEMGRTAKDFWLDLCSSVSDDFDLVSAFGVWLVRYLGKNVVGEKLLACLVFFP